MADSGLLTLPTTLSIPQTIGALFAGFGASSLIFGMFCLQVWVYYSRYPNDALGYKILVGSLWIVELVHQIFIGHAGWFYLVSGFGDSSRFLEQPAWTLVAQVALGAFAGTVVRICFAMRVWKFSNRNYAVTGLIILMTLTQLGLAINYTFESSSLRLVEAVKLKTIATASLGLGAATDIVTALALTYFLLKMRTGYATSDTLIKRLIIYSINTGALTSIFSLAVLITYNLSPTSLVFTGIYFVLCKLYANSCLATLNTRRFVRGRGTDNQENTGPSFLMVARSFRTEHDAKLAANAAGAMYGPGQGQGGMVQGGGGAYLGAGGGNGGNGGGAVMGEAKYTPPYVRNAPHGMARPGPFPFRASRSQIGSGSSGSVYSNISHVNNNNNLGVRSAGSSAGSGTMLGSTNGGGGALSVATNGGVGSGAAGGVVTPTSGVGAPFSADGYYTGGFTGVGGMMVSGLPELEFGRGGGYGRARGYSVGSEEGVSAGGYLSEKEREERLYSYESYQSIVRRHEDGYSPDTPETPVPAYAKAF